jgi:tRNA A-37 threonylcarbamoyl transferase component Bud32/membrane-associated phospholipid phosphatase
VDVPADPPTRMAAQRQVDPAGGVRSGRRRRPTGAPPPLPHHLRTSGAGWLIAAVVLVGLTIVVFANGVRGPAVTVTVADDAVVGWLAGLRAPGLTALWQGLAFAGSWVTLAVLWFGLVLALLVLRRFRHLVVLVVVSELVITGVTVGLIPNRPRPFGVEMRTSWGGWAMPSVQIAALAVTLVGVLYTLVPEGRWRDIGKRAAAALVVLVSLALVALGVEAPTDVLVGAVIGVAVPLLGFRLFTPNEVFPVSYRRGRSAHLDVTGPRGAAIRRALEDQLGLAVEEVKPFGLAGSAGSTPLRITVAGDPPTLLFGKLYAKSHLRADRWYKLGRELLYGRLEDEKPFNTVRRLVQQEDYALSLMQRAGLPSPTPHGFVEITPEREYLLVTEFYDGAVELGEAEADDGVIDDGLGIIRKLWDAGLAHRDIKPANLLVRHGRMLLIDVAFVQARPSPWRQAVDLANMMLCLALRSDPARVYQRALRQFSVDEISEAFSPARPAAARGLALPSQLRRMLRERGRDLYSEFIRLLPAPPRPIAIQRWTVRRVGLWAAVVLLLVVAVQNIGAVYNDWLGGGRATKTFLNIGDLGCDAALEPLWLQAQSVPSAGLVPCVRALPAGWTVASVAVNNGRSVLTLDNDRAGIGAVEVRLTAACDPAGASKAPSAPAGVHRYQRIERTTAAYSATWYDKFASGCVTYRLRSTTDLQGDFANQAPLVLGFITRQALQQALETRSGGRLHLDHETAR